MLLVMALDLKSTLNADANFMCGSLLELVENELEGDNSRKGSSIQ
jgi:hypothetical protein